MYMCMYIYIYICKMRQAALRTRALQRPPEHDGHRGLRGGRKNLKLNLSKCCPLRMNAPIQCEDGQQVPIVKEKAGKRQGEPLAYAQSPY